MHVVSLSQIHCVLVCVSNISNVSNACNKCNVGYSCNACDLCNACIVLHACGASSLCCNAARCAPPPSRLALRLPLRRLARNHWSIHVCNHGSDKGFMRRRSLHYIYYMHAWVNRKGPLAEGKYAQCII